MLNHTVQSWGRAGRGGEWQGMAGEAGAGGF